MCSTKILYHNVSFCVCPSWYSFTILHNCTSYKRVFLKQHWEAIVKLSTYTWWSEVVFWESFTTDSYSLVTLWIVSNKSDWRNILFPEIECEIKNIPSGHCLKLRTLSGQTLLGFFRIVNTEHNSVFEKNSVFFHQNSTTRVDKSDIYRL